MFLEGSYHEESNFLGLHSHGVAITRKYDSTVIYTRKTEKCSSWQCVIPDALSDLLRVTSVRNRWLKFF